jgi:DNA-binding MltR family transcriptional regulator
MASMADLVKSSSKAPEDKSSDSEIPEYITEIIEKLNLKSVESPRAYIVLIVAYIDDLLGKLLSKKLVVLSSDEDSLFSNYGPMYNLGPKIDLAYRMGLISRELSWSLHQMRKMRDDCAHSHTKRGFSDSPTKDYIDVIYEKLKDEDKKTKKSPAEKFQHDCTMIMGLLWQAIDAINSSPEKNKEHLFK